MKYISIKPTEDVNQEMITSFLDSHLPEAFRLDYFSLNNFVCLCYDEKTFEVKDVFWETKEPCIDADTSFIEIPKPIRKRMIDYSVSKSFVPFLADIYSNDERGGFSWRKTEEGYDFWSDVIENESYDLYFEKYPDEKPLESMTVPKDLRIVEIRPSAEVSAEMITSFLNHYLEDRFHKKYFNNNKSIYIYYNTKSFKVVKVSEKREGLYNCYLTNNRFIAIPETIRRRMIKYSSIESFIPFLLNVTSGMERGGFDWYKTKERYSFWEKVIKFGEYDLYYDTYPEELKTENSDMEKGEIRYIKIKPSEKVNEEMITLFLNSYLEDKFKMTDYFFNSGCVYIAYRENSYKILGISTKHDTSANYIICSNNFIALPDTIRNRMIEYSTSKSIIPFLISKYTSGESGGFNWSDTKEGSEFWRNMLTFNNYNEYYKMYPEEKTSFIHKKTLKQKQNEDENQLQREKIPSSGGITKEFSRILCRKHKIRISLLNLGYQEITGRG